MSVCEVRAGTPNLYLLELGLLPKKSVKPALTNTHLPKPKVQSFYDQLRLHKLILSQYLNPFVVKKAIDIKTI